jgi:hypothetical protein
MRKPPRHTFDPTTIEIIYGLEPVFEPGASEARELTACVAVQCPHCSETFETVADLSAGGFNYVEDCQVCCRPIELTGVVDDAGALTELRIDRAG